MDTDGRGSRTVIACQAAKINVVSAGRRFFLPNARPVAGDSAKAATKKNQRLV